MYLHEEYQAFHKKMSFTNLTCIRDIRTALFQFYHMKRSEERRVSDRDKVLDTACSYVVLYCNDIEDVVVIDILQYTISL